MRGRLKIYTFRNEVWLPRPVEEVFAFFSEARNLEILTPPWLSFTVLTRGEIKMEPGTLVDYKLRVHGMPLRWQSEITAWEPPHRFVDEQRRGPYRQWRHEHRFIEIKGGTLATDDVTYAVPGGFLIHKLFVARDVEKIFQYRAEKLRELFPEP